MPKNFKTNKRLLTEDKRLLTEDEKFSRAIFFYTNDNPRFDVIYKDPNNCLTNMVNHYWILMPTSTD